MAAGSTVTQGEGRNALAAVALAILAALTLSVVLMATAYGWNAETASAKSTAFSFSSEPSTTQAGGHPDLISEMTLGNRFNQGPIPPCACNDPKDVTIHAPPGVIANPHVVSICNAADMATFTCAADSQVGFIIVKLFGFPYSVLPIYRTVPQAEQAGLFQFALPVLTFPVPQYISVSGRTGTDYGLDIKNEGISHTVPPEYLATVFWGVPGLPEHDPVRFKPSETQLLCNNNPLDQLLEDVVPGQCELTIWLGGSEEKKPVPSSLPVAPFTQNPTTCVGPLESALATLAYDRETDSAQATWPATTGCDQLSFDPSLSASPSTREADTAAGIDVELKVPQHVDPNTPSASEIRAATMTLPEGFSINPNAADGKTVCSDSEANFGSTAPSHCPEFAKIGTDVLDSSALPAPIPGYIYLGEPMPGDRYRVILTAGGFGTFVKIAGSVHADPATGQLTVSFQNLPQAPFQEFDLHFFGSERGLLATPNHCGTYPVHSTFTPWASELSEQTSTQFFELDSGPSGKPCPNGPRPFDPVLEAGSDDNTAGTYSPFALRVDREDGDQWLSGLTVKTPPGFSASLRGIPYCPEDGIARLQNPAYGGLTELASSACPAASRIGTAVAGTGAGSRPIHVAGRVYLAGPYKGAPLSLLVVIPAVSGPYDLGNVAIRAAVQVDPLTAQVTTVSDPLPRILEGVLLRTRRVQIKLDRPGFALNPTNCDPFSVDAVISGAEGRVSNPSAPFQVANCADLSFRPRLTMRLTGGLKRKGHPAILAILRTKAGEANTGRVSVTLPNGQLLDNAHIRTICRRSDFAQGSCPPGSRIGQAEARTPLLNQPLKGPIYLRSSSSRLPDLVLNLDGQIEVELSAHIDSVRGRLRTTFESLPDAPVSYVKLDLAGGRKGLLINTEDLCDRPRIASLRLAGQNGRRIALRTRLGVPCGSQKRKRRQVRVYRAEAVR
jgi:hypothetical protein